jgi:hypothetical protein
VEGRSNGKKKHHIIIIKCCWLHFRDHDRCGESNQSSNMTKKVPLEIVLTIIAAIVGIVAVLGVLGILFYWLRSRSLRTQRPQHASTTARSRASRTSSSNNYPLPSKHQTSTSNLVTSVTGNIHNNLHHNQPQQSQHQYSMSILTPHPDDTYSIDSSSTMMELSHHHLPSNNNQDTMDSITTSYHPSKTDMFSLTYDLTYDNVPNGILNPNTNAVLSSSFVPQQLSSPKSIASSSISSAAPSPSISPFLQHYPTTNTTMTSNTTYETKDTTSLFNADPIDTQTNADRCQGGNNPHTDNDDDDDFDEVWSYAAVRACVCVFFNRRRRCS